jgi:hypothetical protein
MNLFSRVHRNKSPEALSYELPEGLRNQIVHIWEKGFAANERISSGAPLAYERIYKILCEEHRLLSIPVYSSGSITHEIAVIEYFLNVEDVSKAVDIVQIVFRTMEAMVHRTFNAWNDDIFARAPRTADMIDELNTRFRENNVGYQYWQGEIIKQESQFTHSEIVTPALQVLQQSHLAGANQEFLCAHDHFRHGRFKECINECLKAFESTMKAICDKRGWTYNPTRDTASALIKACENNGLFPVFLESHLTAVRTALESGVPTARNRTSGHGQGSQPTDVSEEFARYVMNLTATNVRFLADSDEKLG